MVAGRVLTRENPSADELSRLGIVIEIARGHIALDIVTAVKRVLRKLERGIQNLEGTKARGVVLHMVMSYLKLRAARTTHDRKANVVDTIDDGTASAIDQESNHKMQTMRVIVKNATAENPTARPGLIRRGESDRDRHIIAVGEIEKDPWSVMLIRVTGSQRIRVANAIAQHSWNHPRQLAVQRRRSLQRQGARMTRTQTTIP